MLPGYILVIDIVDLNANSTESQFREQVASTLDCLDALKGAFDRSPCKKDFYQYVLNEEYEAGCWSVRAIVLISIGKQRATYLVELYKSIAHLIMQDLPKHFDVKASVNKFPVS